MNKRGWIALALVVLFVSSFLWVILKPKEEGLDSRLFPFYLPWDDSKENIVSLSRWLDKPAGKFGHVYIGEDGHLYVGDKRIRFLGVNICGGAAFPRKEDSGKIAARLAKFGVNIVRFHHMDAAWESFNIFNKTFEDTRHLNKEALDRLDYFIAKLKENGIYVDLNLLVSRRFTSADGLPYEIDLMYRKDQHLLGFFVDDIKVLEKEYAMQLLTHRNPYTGLTYAEDPVVAFVEIVNEQGLIRGWLRGAIDNIPEVFKKILQERWNEYLRLKYGSTDKLKESWNADVDGSFKGFLLKDGENIEESTVNIFSVSEFKKRTPTAQKDWIDFLFNLEENYFTEFYNYLKEDLNVKALVIGTIVGCSTPNIMSKLDMIDTHAYWQHPKFPGKPWDPSNWYVINEPMVSKLDEGTIPKLALKRVYGKPHLVSEYNHPSPNMYDAETSIILATYAAIQDWDGILLFDYGRLDDWDAKRIRGYFDIDQHPVKMATLIPAYMIFVRGDVNPANDIVTARLSRQKEMEIISSSVAKAWTLPDGSHLGVSPITPLIHGTALIVDGGPEPHQSLSRVNVTGPVYRSDTGEVIWDASDREKAVLLVNASRSKAVVGFGGGRRFNFGDLIIEPDDTLLNGWSVITITVMDGEDFSSWDNLLLIAGGYVTNTGMKIREYEYEGRITCGTHWGTSPTLVEGIPATVKIKTSKEITVWALNNIGERLQKIPVSTRDDYKVFKIGPEYETIWYEISS